MMRGQVKNLVYKGLSVLLSLALFCCLSSVSFAVTFTVNNAGDEEDANVGGAFNGICATAGGVCTLRAAIQEANAAATDDVIDIPAGQTITYNSACTGCAAINAHEYTATDDLTVNCNGSTLETDQSLSLRFMDINDNDTTVTFNNCVFDSWGEYVGFGFISGGVFLVEDGTLEINSSTLSDARARLTGGAIDVDAGAAATIDLSIFSSNRGCNSIIDDGGGAIMNSGALTVTNSTFNSNTCNNAASPARGGAIYHEGTDLTITDVAFVTNTTYADSGTADGGGAIAIESSTNPVSITTTTFSGNQALVGGALVVMANTVNLTNVTCSENNVTDASGRGTDTPEGGCVYQSGGTINFNNSILCGNTTDGNGPDGFDDGGVIGGNNANILCDNTNFTDFANVTGDIDAGLDVFSNDVTTAANSFYPLTAISAAINAGDSNDCAADDQLDNDWSGNNCELGAYAADTVSCEVSAINTLANVIALVNAGSCSTITFANTINTVTIANNLTLTANNATINCGGDVTIQTNGFIAANTLLTWSGTGGIIQNCTFDGEDVGRGVVFTGDTPTITGSTFIDFDVAVHFNNVDTATFGGATSALGNTCRSNDVCLLVEGGTGASIRNNLFGLRSNILSSPNQYALALVDVSNCTVSNNNISSSSQVGFLGNGIATCTISNNNIGTNRNGSRAFFTGAVQELGMLFRIYTSSPDSGSLIPASATQSISGVTLSANTFCFNNTHLDINGVGDYTVDVDVANTNSFCTPSNTSSDQPFIIRNGANDGLSPPSNQTYSLGSCSAGSTCSVSASGTATAGSTVRLYYNERTQQEIDNDAAVSQALRGDSAENEIANSTSLSQHLGDALTDISGNYSETFTITTGSDAAGFDFFAVTCSSSDCTLTSGADSPVRQTIAAGEGSANPTNSGGAGCSLMNGVSMNASKLSVVLSYFFILLTMYFVNKRLRLKVKSVPPWR